MTSGNHSLSTDLYHVLLSVTHISKDPNNVIEKVRIPGSYVSLPAAKAAAYSCLYNAGYERGFFTEYETNREAFENQNLSDRRGLAVLAVAPDGTTFRIRMDTTPNHEQLEPDNDDRLIPIALYYVIQTTAQYNGQKEVIEVRDLSVLGAFICYREARKYADNALLSNEDAMTKETYAAYDEAAPNETDCGYGGNVVAHAIGQYGENYLISVIETEELGSVTLAEAAMRIL